MKTTEMKQQGTIDHDGNDIRWSQEDYGLIVYYEEDDLHMEFEIVKSDDEDGSYEYETLDMSYGDSSKWNDALCDLQYDIGDIVVNELEKTGVLVGR